MGALQPTLEVSTLEASSDAESTFGERTIVRFPEQPSSSSRNETRLGHSFTKESKRLTCIWLLPLYVTKKVRPITPSVGEAKSDFEGDLGYEPD